MGHDTMCSQTKRVRNRNLGNKVLGCEVRDEVATGLGCQECAPPFRRKFFPSVQFLKRMIRGETWKGVGTQVPQTKTHASRKRSRKTMQKY